MIEVIHFQTRDGRQLAGVFGVNNMSRTAEVVRHEQRYAVGLEPAFYPLPAVIYHVYLPSVSGEYGSIWEHTRFSCEPYEVTFNKRVRVLPPPPVDYTFCYALQLVMEIWDAEKHNSL